MINIDTSAWKLEDSEWVKARSEQWRKIEQWYDEKGFWSEDFETQQKAAYKLFFETGKIDKRFNQCAALARFHPSPDIDTIKELVKLRENEYKDRYILALSSSFYPLFKKGLIPQQTQVNIFLAISGKDYDEMSVLRGFDPINDLPIAVDSLFPTITNWFKSGEPESLPIDLLVVHFKSVLKYITPETIDSVGFRINRTCKRIGGYKPIPVGDTEKQTQIANELQTYLLSGQVNNCVRMVAEKYIK